MDIYLIVYAVLGIYFVFSIYRYYKYQNKGMFEVSNGVVTINPTKELSFSFEDSPQINIESIKTIQLADNCISLFNHSGNATDLWVHKKYLNYVLEKVQKTFPSANFVKIES